jgi:aspartate aminotransferase
VTNGGKHALFNTFLALVNDGDEVLLPAPYWVSYPEMIRIAGGEAVELPTTEETGFRVTVEQLEAATTPRTKALVFVSPSNPTGAVYPVDEVEAIGRWAANKGIWIITDEIYEHLVYGDARFSSMPVLVPELADRCVVVNGVAKTYAMTGWRVGWMAGPLSVITAASSLQSHATSNVSNVSQAAALAAVSGDLSAAEEMRAAFDRRRRTMHKMLSEIDGARCHEPQGAFYCFPSFREVLGRRIGGRDIDSTDTLAEVILEKVKVAIVPGGGFGAPGYARFSYALGDDDLVEGIGRIADLLAG